MANSARTVRIQVRRDRLVDCCGGPGERSGRAVWRQMEAAGVVLSGVPSFLSALISDLDSADGRTVMNALAACWS